MVKRSRGLKGRVSRIGSYAIASAITDQCITCTTFNILAPIYKRLTDKVKALSVYHASLIDGMLIHCGLKLISMYLI